MMRTVEEIAQDCDMPAWKAAEVMIRLMVRELTSPPEDTSVEDHVAWLKATYPKPKNIKEQAG